MAENAKELTKEELAELTPMMQHYLQTKEQYPGCILFYRKLKTGFFVMTGFRGGNMPSGRLAECAAEKEAVSLHDSAIY